MIDQTIVLTSDLFILRKSVWADVCNTSEEGSSRD